jgi:hypothetical protein
MPRENHPEMAPVPARIGPPPRKPPGPLPRAPFLSSQDSRTRRGANSARARNSTCLGAARLKEFCGTPASEGAIGRILRRHGLTRKRKKKRQKKRGTRELKARFEPFEENQEDAKHLNDIPFYVEGI